MSYRLEPGRSVAHEVKRIVRGQLARAVASVERRGAPQGDTAIREARRHIKRARALLKLVGPTLRSAAAGDKRLRTAKSALAPIGDALAAVETIDRLERRYGGRLQSPALGAIRAALVARAARVHRETEADHALLGAVRILRSERRRVSRWRLKAVGFHAIAPGLRRSYRRARTALALALAEPTVARYHAWRRRGKDLWLQALLLEGRCPRGLRAQTRRLEALDDCLGAYHDLTRLEQVLVGEMTGPRVDIDRCLRWLRRYQSELRQESRTLATRVLADTPREFVRRVRRAWRPRRAARARR